MNFNYLVENGLKKYLDSLDIENKLIVYLHLPKAAGNSSIKAVKSAFNNIYSVRWNDIDNSWLEFIEEHKKSPYQFVSGHFNDRHLDLLREKGVNFYAITFLRHPIERIISLYKYNSMTSTPNSAKFVQKFTNFENFALKGVPPNHIAKTLIRGAFSTDDYLLKLSKKYDFIGLTENYNLSMYILSQILKFKFTKEPRLNVSKNDTALDLSLNYHSYQSILERHNLDIAVHGRYLQMYRVISENLVDEFIENQENN